MRRHVSLHRDPFDMTKCAGTVSPIPDDDMLPMEAAAHAEAIRHALSEVASTSGESSSRQRGGWTSSEDEGDDRDFDFEGRLL